MNASYCQSLCGRLRWPALAVATLGLAALGPTHYCLAAKHKKKAVAVAAAAAAPTVPPPPGTLVRDDFNDPSLPLWTQKDDVSVKGGFVTLGDQRDNTENSFIYTNAPHGNFVFEARARLISDPKAWGGFGLWFRSTNSKGLVRDGGTGYCFGYVPGEGGLEFVRYPNSHPMAPNLPYPIDHNWHAFRVVAAGPKLQGFIDGKPVFAAVDSTYTVGAVGIGAWNSGVVQVDWVSIKEQ